MTVIKLEIPSDNELAIEAAALFFAHLSDLPFKKDEQVEKGAAETASKQVETSNETESVDTQQAVSADDLQQYPIDRGDGTMVDFEGRMWDRRIDSSNKKCYKDTGLWMRRKNLDDEFYNTVKAEVAQASIQAPSSDEPEIDLSQDEPIATESKDNGDVGNAFKQTQQTQDQPPADDVITVADYYRIVMAGGFTTDQQAQVSQEFGLDGLTKAVAKEKDMPGLMGQIINRLKQLKGE